MRTAKQTKRLKLWIRLTIILCSIIFGLGVILLGAIGYFRLPINNYYKNSQKAFVIPQLNSGFVPQGFAFNQEENHYLATGYMQKGEASPVFIIDKTSGETIKQVNLLLADGSDYTGHAGGISFYKDFVFVADGHDNCLFIYDYNQIKNAESGAGIKSIGKFSTQSADGDSVSPAFVEVYGDKLVVGEFFREGNYPTPQSHHLTTPAGDKNTALAVEFALGEQFSDTFFINPVPQKAYSMPKQVQGMAFDANNIYLSTSWGLSFSQIFVYDQTKATSQTKTVLGVEIPVYYLDSASNVKTLKIAPMSEEMVISNGKLLVMCESASNKYIFGKLTGGKWCYATDLSSYGLN